jgi:quinoprotein glucose dehydrogenase
VKPPYGVLSAINLDRGELVWQVPHGDTPDVVRNHPALRGLNIPKTGQQGTVGDVVTKTLVVMGDPQVTTTPDHPRGAMLTRLQQAERPAGRGRLDAGASERFADDLLG